MHWIVAMSAGTGTKVAEVGFLMFVIAGVWFVVSEFDHNPKRVRMRHVVAGTLVAVGGVLLIVATHWGHFG